MRVFVIMAGGSGERFWPLSRKSRPKQLLPLTSADPMLAEAVSRAWKVPGVQQVYIVAGAPLREPILNALPGFPPDNLLVEPEGRNTAPCLAFAAAVAAARDGWDTTMGVLTADSLIRNTGAFSRNADLAFENVERQDILMTFGVRPLNPNTGFGYLEAGEIDTRESRGSTRHVNAFREKPDQTTAESYVASGHHFWNAGMFFWKCSTLKTAMDEFAPELARGAEKIAAEVGKPGFEETLRGVFAQWPKISIDYAVMEKAQNVRMIEAEFDWDDVGTWNALARTRALDASGNLRSGNAILIDSANMIVFNAGKSGKEPPESTEPLIAALGVDNLVVAMAEGTVLVCHRDRVQDIKMVLEKLRADHAEKYL